MQKKQTPHTDTLNTQLNVEETHKESSTLVEQEEIKGTPFRLCKYEEEWFLAIGNNKITHGYKTKEEALERLDIDKWFIIMHMAIIMIEQKNKGAF